MYADVACPRSALLALPGYAPRFSSIHAIAVAVLGFLSLESDLGRAPDFAGRPGLPLGAAFFAVRPG